MAKAKQTAGNESLLLPLLLAEVQALLLRLFDVVDAACTMSTSGDRGFVMDDFMANLFGFPPGSRMFVNDQDLFERALLNPIVKREVRY